MSTLFQGQHRPNEPNTMFSPRTQHTSSMQQPEVAKRVFVHINGDKHNPGKKFVINPRHVSDFEALLKLFTDGLSPPFGAIRNVYTPSGGHRVHQLQEINSGMRMVVGGNGKFQKLQYTDIIPPSKRPAKPKNILPDLRYHNRMNVPGRLKEGIKSPLSIHVYGNGNENNPAVKVLLIPRIMKNWGLVLDEITEKIKPDRAVRQLFTISGISVADTDELKNGNYYVAAGSEKFKDCLYGTRYQPHPVMLPSPRKQQGFLPPIKGRAKPLNPKTDQTYSQQYVKKKQMEDMRSFPHTTPGAGRQPPHGKRLKPIKPSGPPPPTSDSDSVFHAKPVKVKRSGASGKLTHVAPSSEHEDDVFRAKTTGEKAEEIADDESTKVDLPLDQVKARTVEDEDIPAEHREKESSPVPVPSSGAREENKNSETHVIEEPVKTPTSPDRSEREHVITPPGEAGEGTPLGGNVIEPEESTPPPQAKAKLGSEEAATRIQANYRGYRVRTNMKKNKMRESAQIHNRLPDEKPDLDDEIPQNLPLHTTTSDGAVADPIFDSPPLERSPISPDAEDNPEVPSDDKRTESVEGGRESPQMLRKPAEAKEDEKEEYEDDNTAKEDEEINLILPPSETVAETPIQTPPKLKEEEQGDDEIDGKKSRAEEGGEDEREKKSTPVFQPEHSEPQGDPTEINEPVFDLSSGQMISKPVLETPEPSEEYKEKLEANHFPDRDSGDGVDENENINPDEKSTILENGDNGDAHIDRSPRSPTLRAAYRVSTTEGQANELTKPVENGQAIPNGQPSTLEGSV